MAVTARSFGLPAAIVSGFLQFIPLAADEIRRQRRTLPLLQFQNPLRHFPLIFGERLKGSTKTPLRGVLAGWVKNCFALPFPIRWEDKGMAVTARSFGLPAAVVFGFLQFIPLLYKKLSIILAPTK
ncbi:hypothetical protein D3C74_416120 [compost metagenome]